MRWPGSFRPRQTVPTVWPKAPLSALRPGGPALHVNWWKGEGNPVDFTSAAGRHWPLVAPIVDRDATARDVYLPKGNWQDFWTGDQHEGASSSIGRMPTIAASPYSFAPDP